MGLFKEENNKVIVDPEIKLIPEFDAILKADKTKSKVDAVNIFAYIYFVYDFRSPYAIYTLELRKSRVSKILPLENMKFDSAIVEAAIATYIELNETPITKTLIKTKEVLLTAVDILEKIRVQIITMTEVEEMEVTVLGSAIGLITNCLTLAERIPKNVKVLGDLEDQIRKDLASTSKIRGGGTVNPFEE